jgi:hypothetical protein
MISSVLYCRGVSTIFADDTAMADLDDENMGASVSRVDPLTTVTPEFRKLKFVTPSNLKMPGLPENVVDSGAPNTQSISSEAACEIVILPVILQACANN